MLKNYIKIGWSIFLKNKSHTSINVTGRTIYLASVILFLSQITVAQVTTPPDNNKKASVSENIGITKVKVTYARPSVNGREGKIWGDLVHYGFQDLGYGTSKAAPWRAGANENTTIEFTTDVTVEGQALAKGKYGFFVAMGAEKAVLIFSKTSTAWGSFYYDPSQDALRGEVPVLSLKESVERLKFEFDNQTKDAATLSLHWEKVRIPFEIKVDLQETLISAFRREVNSGEFYSYWQNMHMAADYCLKNEINLEEALEWSERSINTFFGEPNFKTLSTYSGILAKLNRTTEADSVMAKALPMGKVQDLFNYGYGLASKGSNAASFKIWKMAYDKDQGNDYAILGMAMGNYLNGNKEEAIEMAQRGNELTKQNGFKNFYSTLIPKMKSDKSIF